MTSTRTRTALLIALLAWPALSGCASTPTAPSTASPSTTAAAPPALTVQPSGKTGAEVIAALPQTLGGRKRADNGVNPRQVTVAAKPATLNSYVYKGEGADDYVAIQVALTPDAAALFPAGVARLQQPQTIAGATCGVGGLDGRQMNVCYALLNDGVLTVTEPDGKLASLGSFTDRLARATP